MNRGTRRILLAFLVAGVLGLCAGALVVAGYAVAYYDVAPYRWYFQRLEGQVFRVFSKEPARRHEKSVETIFLQLEREIGVVPVERKGTGGGLTSFGDAVLLLTHEGKIFAARSAKQVSATSIETPENGYSAYVKAAQSERYRGYEHRFDRFRYNDILHYSTPGGQGLAVSYTEFDGAGECYRNAVAILALAPTVRSAEQIAARKQDWEVVYRARPCLPLKKQGYAIEGHMAGGRMAFSAPSTIYLGSGDYHWDALWAPQAYAQDPEKEYGKVIAIDLASRKSRIVSRGNRNMQGVVVDSGGQLWVAEHGIRGGDELNRIVEGADYGWPSETLGTLYNRMPVPNTRSYGRHETFTAPAFAWLPSVAISSLTLIRGLHPAWDGDLLLATLKDESLYRIRVEKERVLFSERIRIGSRIRYAHQHTDGRLVLWTDDRELMFLSLSKRVAPREFVDAWLAKSGKDDAQRRRIGEALDACLQCHSLEPGVHAGAPGLAGIYGDRMGATGYGEYSEALRRRSGRWSREELAAFLKDPAAVAPGTRMPNPGISDPAVLAGVIDVLEAVKKWTEASAQQ